MAATVASRYIRSCTSENGGDRGSIERLTAVMGRVGFAAARWNEMRAGKRDRMRETGIIGLYAPVETNLP